MMMSVDAGERGIEAADCHYNCVVVKVASQLTFWKTNHRYSNCMRLCYPLQLNACRALVYSFLCSTARKPPSAVASSFVIPMVTMYRTPRLSSTSTTVVSMTPSRSTKRVKTEHPETPVERKKTNTPPIVTPSSGAAGTPVSAIKERKSTVKPSTKAPADWQTIYSLVEELRKDRTAPCDHAGCEALPDPKVSPEDYRFQVLLSLMLSSQTKDAVVGQTIRSMQADNVCNVHAISKMSPTELNAYINKVGFHNNKTKYIKETVEILLERCNGDIPSCAKEMMKLPGVGPKMAFICENVAWNLQTGIGVDTHMHRIFNQLRWVKSNTPEQTRVQLEAWLPQENWRDVNLLWVGFGQEVQQFKEKILRKALGCSRPKEALNLLKRCGLDYVKEGKKLGMDAEVKMITQSNK